MLTNYTVEIKNLIKVYKKVHSNKRNFSSDSAKEPSFACNNVNFSANEGSVTVLLGPNGAGKSTLLKALCGIHYPTAGSVSVYGNSDIEEIRRITGYVGEVPELDLGLTVKETLFSEAYLHGINQDKACEYIKKAISVCQLEDVINQKVSTLSKGYKQRTSFAKALSFNPKVLVLDEYSGGLDPAQIANMRKAIKKLSKDKTIILSTHHIEEAENLCDYIYIMNKGKVAASGTLDEILSITKTKSLENAFLQLTEGVENEE